jgi:hypothetical protein
MSYCTRFDGTYTDAGGRQQVVDVGGRYRLRVHMHGPVSLADQGQHVTPRVDEVRECLGSKGRGGRGGKRVFQRELWEQQQRTM